MKTYQLFTEQLNTDPKIGDYVICDDEKTGDSIRKFLNNNIGQITHIATFTFAKSYNPNEMLYNVKYNIPKDSNLSIAKNFYFNNSHKYFLKSQILFFSPNIEETQKELEILQNINNFNL